MVINMVVGLEKDVTDLLSHAIRRRKALEELTDKEIRERKKWLNYDIREDQIDHPTFYERNKTRPKFETVKRFYLQMPSEQEAIGLIAQQVEALGLEGLTYDVNFTGHINMSGSRPIAPGLRASVNLMHGVTYEKGGVSVYSNARLNSAVQDDGNFVWSATLDDTKDSVLAKLQLAKQGYLVVAVGDVATAQALGQELVGSGRIVAYRAMSEQDLRNATGHDSHFDVVPTLMYPRDRAVTASHQQSVSTYRANPNRGQ